MNGMNDHQAFAIGSGSGNNQPQVPLGLPLPAIPELDLSPHGVVDFGVEREPIHDLSSLSACAAAAHADAEKVMVQMRGRLSTHASQPTTGMAPMGGAPTALSRAVSTRAATGNLGSGRPTGSKSKLRTTTGATGIKRRKDAGRVRPVGSKQERGRALREYRTSALFGSEEREGGGDDDCPKVTPTVHSKGVMSKAFLRSNLPTPPLGRPAKKVKNGTLIVPPVVVSKSAAATVDLTVDDSEHGDVETSRDQAQHEQARQQQEDQPATVSPPSLLPTTQPSPVTNPLDLLSAVTTELAHEEENNFLKRMAASRQQRQEQAQLGPQRQAQDGRLSQVKPLQRRPDRRLSHHHQGNPQASTGRWGSCRVPSNSSEQVKEVVQEPLDPIPHPTAVPTPAPFPSTNDPGTASAATPTPASTLASGPTTNTTGWAR